MIAYLFFFLFFPPVWQQKSEAKEEEEGGVKDLPEEEVRTRIEEYNSRVSENGMKLVSCHLPIFWK